MPGSRATSGLPPGVRVGATGPRLLAALVEVGPIWLLVGLTLLFAYVVEGKTLLAVGFLLLALAWAVLVWAQRVTRAAGPGMRLDSLQIVGRGDGRPIGWGRVLLRWLVFAGLTVSGVGLIAMAVAMSRHQHRQGWHDLAADAVVIRERPATRIRPSAAVVRVSERALVEHTLIQPAPIELGSVELGSVGPDPVELGQVEPVPGATPVGSPTIVVSTPARAPTQSKPEVGDPQAFPSDLEWWLRLDDGRDVGVDGLVLLGRNPQPRVGEEDATLIKVVDRTRTVSKSHLAVGVNDGGLYVMDRGSTNGTTVTEPDGGRWSCPPGDPIGVPVGSVIRFGDRWLQVRRPGRQEMTVPAGDTG